jgi:hypothetical protein
MAQIYQTSIELARVTESSVDRRPEVNVMRRTIVTLVLGVCVTGLFLFGLAWMTTLKERAWSNNQPAFHRQGIFFVAVVSIVIGVIVLNRVLNRPRSLGRNALEGRHSPTLAERSDHPLRDRLLDG